MEDMGMKKVIITGANGFIGRNLASFLRKNGVEVYCMVHSVICEELKGCNIVKFELDDIFAAEKNLPVNVDAFYHLAWNGVSSSVKDDFSVQYRNIEYSLNALKLAEKIGAKKIIFSGSVSEYAYSDNCVDGNNVPAPSDMYSACKISTHYVCDIYARKNNLNFIWTLIPSIYGPGRNDSNIITYSIKTFLEKKKPSFTKLEQKWDYVYIDDLINALFLTGEKGLGGNVYVIGSGKADSLAHYIEIIRDAIDSKLPMGIGELPYKTTKIDNSVVDISLLKKHTGYEPNVSFEEGIKNTIEYFRKILI